MELLERGEDLIGLDVLYEAHLEVVERNGGDPRLAGAEVLGMMARQGSPEELGTIARLLAGKRAKIPLYVFASKGVIDRNHDAVEAIEKSGAKVYADTCMVVSPVMERYKGIMVNSGKALAYVPDMCRSAGRIGTTEECVRVATE